MRGHEKGHAQPRDVEGGRIVARPVPPAGGVAADEPGRPVLCLLAVGFGRGAIRPGRLVTVGTGMRRAISWHVPAADAQQITFVLENPPQLPSDLRVVAPDAPAPTHPSTPTDGFERRQVLPTDQPAVMQQRE